MKTNNILSLAFASILLVAASENSFARGEERVSRGRRSSVVVDNSAQEAIAASQAQLQTATKQIEDLMSKVESEKASKEKALKALEALATESSKYLSGETSKDHLVNFIKNLIG